MTALLNKVLLGKLLDNFPQALGRVYLLNGDGRYCVHGWALRCAGVPDEELLGCTYFLGGPVSTALAEKHGLAIFPVSYPGAFPMLVSNAADLIAKIYGGDGDDWALLMEANDELDDDNTRAKAMKERLIGFREGGIDMKRGEES